MIKPLQSPQQLLATPAEQAVDLGRAQESIPESMSNDLTISVCDLYCRNRFSAREAGKSNRLHALILT